jgi:lipoate-protein ligase A
VLGSAQRRHRGAILQHGSLLAAKSQAAPELPGLSDLIGVELQIEGLVTAITVKLTEALNIRPIPDRLSKKLESKAADLANKKYSSEIWTNRR